MRYSSRSSAAPSSDPATTACCTARMSPPAQKARPSPRMATARMVSSAAHSLQGGGDGFDHAVGQGVQRLRPGQGQKAQAPAFFGLNMGVGNAHFARDLRGIGKPQYELACAACAATTGEHREPSAAYGGARATHEQIIHPALRMRRTRRHDWTRRLVAETSLSPADFIWPVFVIEGDNKREAVASMPGVERLSVDLVVKAAKEAAGLGIPVIALFPQTPAALKTEDGREALNADNLVCRAVRAIKAAVPEIGVMCDVALDPYTSHGHDGVLRDGDVHNDATIDMLVQQSLVQVAAGCDIIAPSDMMDGRIGAIRAGAGKGRPSQHLADGLCRQVCQRVLRPVPRRGGHRPSRSPATSAATRWIPANGDEAMREVALDLAEGADMVMVKPGMPYLDLVRRVKERFGVPTFAYQVSGEYAMLSAAFEKGWLDRDRAVIESLTGFKRAGASGILTYFAVEAARLLRR